MRCTSSSLVLALGLILVTLVSACHGEQLYVGYYKRKCWKYNVEEIIFNVVKAKFAKDPTIVAGLIRLQFHDCIVRGCDASVLLDGPKTEKTANPNQSLRGFYVIDAAKAALEKACPGVVSCADVLNIAARSAVFLAGGKWYYVETGRRDGLVSHKSEALANLPSENIPVRDAVNLFASRGLSKEDFVVLLGAHTVGTTHCDKFEDRLYNYHNTGKPDARMNTDMLYALRKRCPNKKGHNNNVYFSYNPRSHYRMDNTYYKQLLVNQGILGVDANIGSSPLTNSIVKKLAYAPGYFDNKFGPAMVNMGRIGVLTGKQGEIRKYCGAVNYRKH
ncbi:peroxidase 57 [Beta vulgaris subsp. vulgaris]|uniref:peroxidase 57 n=1 Tax=Beta vulgaris subsp. vulgaris TaxID=3555 RepID=UPI002036EA54|nr:peroxidase 57 [Beta vulgaris subsp. vulgaris]XP_048489653.1 peroxidase 57 [Beta vulgaris subsp. vulgaris]